jgi:hypothetical protein
MGIKENNILIAKFLGLKVAMTEEETSKLDEKYGEDKVVLGYASMKYHESWEALMQVVDKIESIEDDNRYARYNVEIVQDFVTIYDNYTSEEIVDLDGGNKMVATYCAVIEFIKYYNTLTSS